MRLIVCTTQTDGRTDGRNWYYLECFKGIINKISYISYTFPCIDLDFALSVNIIFLTSSKNNHLNIRDTLA